MPNPHSPIQESTIEEAQPSHKSGVRNTSCLDGFFLKPTQKVGLLIAGRYEVEGFLGEGGTAFVFLARDNQSGRLLVIKRMKDEIAAHPELRSRFLLEARALACVDHPAVIRVLDIDEPEDEPPFLTLEALQGETLGDYLKREGVLSIEMALRLFAEATLALSAVHRENIVHRDIKPDNLFLVGPIGNPLSLKVLDFGMARLSDEAHDEESTSILGTAQYMAPEQILVEPVDARTDIYSLGVVLFRALTGHLPFEVDNRHDLMRHQLFSPVPPVHWLLDGLPVELEEIVERATRKSPDARFQNMAALGEALGQVGERQYSELRATGELQVDADECADSLFQDPEQTEGTHLDASFGELDVYEPTTARGKKAARVLAAQFGVYARPHIPSRDSISVGEYD